MDGTVVFGWAIWGLFLVAALIYWAELSFDVYNDHPILLSDAFRALGCTLLTIWFFLFPEWNKLHLFWLAILVLSAAEWIEYRRLPPVIRAMRGLVGEMPLKRRPSPALRVIPREELRSSP